MTKPRTERELISCCGGLTPLSHAHLSLHDIACLLSPSISFLVIWPVLEPRNQGSIALPTCVSRPWLYCSVKSLGGTTSTSHFHYNFMTDDYDDFRFRLGEIFISREGQTYSCSKTTRHSFRHQASFGVC